MSAAPLDVGSLDVATKAALRRLVLTLADSKRMMGIRYSDWLLGAPSIESGIAASSMAQDEWGHARLLYAMLKDLGEDPVPVEHDRPREEYASVAALDEPLPDWAALIAAMVLVDGAITVMLASFADGVYEAARNRVPKMLAEEQFHSSLGRAWYRRLADSSDEARALLRAATQEMLPSILAWVGADDEAAEAMVAAGVVGSASDRIARYRDDVGDLVALVGIDIAGAERAGEWDAQRGRTTGQPDQESIERVRGDRNRALFVE